MASSLRSSRDPSQTRLKMAENVTASNDVITPATIEAAPLFVVVVAARVVVVYGAAVDVVDVVVVVGVVVGAVVVSF